MINFNSYINILNNPKEKNKLISSNFDFSIHDNYAVDFAIDNLDIDLLTFLQIKKFKIDNFQLFKKILETPFNETYKTSLSNFLLFLSLDPDLWEMFYDYFKPSEEIPKIDETSIKKENIQQFDNFVKYFYDYVDNFNVTFWQKFFLIRKIYPIFSKEAFLMISKLFLKYKEYIPSSTLLNTTHIYFGKIENFEDLFYRISPELIEPLINFFFNDELMIFTNTNYALKSIINWATENRFSKETVEHLLKLRYIGAENRDRLKNIK